MKTFSEIEQVIEDFRNGKFVIIVDDEDRENEGDLAFASQMCTPEKINFMARYARGLICIAMEGKRLEASDTNDGNPEHIRFKLHLLSRLKPGRDYYRDIRSGQIHYNS